MQIDIGSYIAELLYERHSVNIPGLGGFITRYKPAEIDQVQGKLHPPARSLEFNDNLGVNDGVLIDYVKEKDQLSLRQAEEAVDEYVQGVKQAIEQREIVVFPRVGRLYKDYEQKLQFLPENTNFNTDAFGLPVVQYYPVGKASKASAGTPAAVAGESPKKAVKTLSSANIANWFQEYLPYIATITLVIVVIGVLLFLNDLRQPVPPGATESEVPTSRLNTKPGVESPAAGESQNDRDAESIDDPEDIDDLRGDNASSTSPDTEGITPVPGRKYAVVAIGIFGSQENVTRLTEKIYKAGYEPYLEERGQGLTRVGIQFPYENEAEVDRELENIRDQFESKAFVLKKGEE